MRRAGGTLLVVVGLVVGAVLLWHGPVAGSLQTSAAQERSQAWSAHPTPSVPNPLPTPVAEAPARGEVIGNLYVPRFGDDYVRTIAEGTTTDILDNPYTGVGHYEGTDMPGGPGNFAIAAHRAANGGGLRLIDTLVPGDKIIVETVEGWYTYVHTHTEIVEPEQVDVLLPVPGKHTITLTSCTPIFTSEDRIIAYGDFESFTPR